MDDRNKTTESLSNNLPKFGPHEKWRILKNVFALSFAFMVQFTAFMGTANLQSSVNIEAGLGTASLAVIYGSLILSNMFLSVAAINWLGCKWAAAISQIAYMPYIAAQFYPTFYTLIPAALMVGLGGGPLWVSKCTYLSVVSNAYESITGISAEVVVVSFFGMFFMIFQFAQVWGNLISSLILSNDNGEILNVPEISNICGPNFVARASQDVIEKPPVENMQLIASIYLICMALAVIIIALGVDPLTRYETKRQGSGTGVTGIRLLSITIKLLKEKKQLLILPITIWLGVAQVFLGADYTSSYVACAWGTGKIGYVMISYGLFNSLSAIVTGSLVKITGRVPVVLFATLLHIAIIITLLSWKPSPEDGLMYFAMSGLWGVCDGVWIVQINALCGIMFPKREEAAYSNFRIWESLGFIMAYVYSPYLRTDVKLYILLIILIIGIVLYLVIERQLAREGEEKLSVEEGIKKKDGKMYAAIKLS